MAESLLFSVAESLIGKLASRAVEEASQVLGLYDDVRELKETVSLIKAVLLDAEQKQQQNNELCVWLSQIKRVFSDAEDIIDDFECEALRKHAVNTYGSCTRMVRQFFSTCNPLVYRLRMAHHIKDVKKRLDKVAADRNKFGLQTIENDTRVVHRREMTHSHVAACHVIGRKHDKKNIIKLLLHDGDGKSLSVIPIVGIGGLGKTTLAQSVFNDKSIDESFPLKMWVCVSDNFELEDMLRKILKSATDNSTSAPTFTHQESFKSYDMEQLQRHLRNKLAGKKFLLVLDDVWNEDRVKWIELKNLLGGGAEGSKILVTTRSHSIASMMGTNSSYNLKGLSPEDSLSLFVKWAFKEEGEERRYPELLQIGKEIVKKCGGLPLALRTLGSSLFLKVDKEEWECVRDNDIWNLPQKQGDILPALKSSYDQLPSYLKRCFACFSLFPKDYDFTNFILTRLWLALGFLPSPNKNKTSEDVGIELLRELQSRSFLQDFIDHGTACCFKLHDLVYDLAMYVAKDEFQLINSSSPDTSENVRHMSFIKNDLLSQTSIPRGLRCINFPEGAKNEAFLNTLVSRCKYLRFLDLSHSKYESLPSSIGKLKHLRSLSLAHNDKLVRLPSSVCELQHLQALSLGGCTKIQTLPKGIGNMISLRLLSISAKQSDFPAKLTSLEILDLSHCDNLESLFEGVQLPNLKWLTINSCGSLKSLPLHATPNLESLVIVQCNKLELSKGLDSQILELSLKLVYLYSLPQLVTLPQWLQRSASTLRSLTIKDCNNLKELPEWLSTLIFLKKLLIHNCPELLSLPDDMHGFTNLEELDIQDCPELCRRYRPENGRDWPKISHIKKVLIGELQEERNF